MSSLLQKNVPVEPLCQVCRSEVETVEHIICSCELAMQCWQRILPQDLYMITGNVHEWWGRVLEVCDNEKKAEVASVCWSLWKARNELVWNKNYTRVNVVIAKAKQYLLQWSLAQKNKSQSCFPYFEEGYGKEIWVAPQMEYKKVSADASIFSEYNSSGVGLIARDSKGELIQARTKSSLGLISSNMAEAMAVKEALSWIYNEGWSRVVVESDCLTVVQAIRSKVQMQSPFGQVIQYCRNLLEVLNTVSLFLVKRSANMAAHELARLSYSFPDRVFDRSSVPIVVNDVIRRELSY